ncbi:hypothetical protein [Rhizobium indigoferae]|uniref:Toxin-antitoxin system HicB family antitoxin n=1 Tax=Rhizobium indigoferae TaxID=158891 RepID=A0ABZ0Z6F9_9HYPH|nr:hypothetical protein [Rhizobium indigoferae]WQN35150.1 hypothetical protein U5G49_000173 [Rhizobium indigoferae]
MTAKTENSTCSIVPLSLTGGRVTKGFRDALFDGAARAGISVNEFVLLAAGDKLVALGRDFPGVFAAEKRSPDEPARGHKRRSTGPIVNPKRSIVDG